MPKVHIGSPSADVAIAVAVAIMELDTGSQTVETIAERAGVHENTGYRALMWMIREGWVTRERMLAPCGTRMQWCHFYRLSEPAKVFLHFVSSQSTQ